MRTLLLLLTTLVLAGAGLAPSAMAETSPAPTGATRVVVVRPVTADGAPAAGWRVHRQKGRVSCGGASASAVDRGIRTCYPAALYLPSCWASTGHTVLCLRDVTTRRLVRIHYRGHFGRATPAEEPTPQGLRLGDGESCTIRVGGAWGTVPAHPRWLGFDSCTDGSVYGPPRGDGIDRARPKWRVHVVAADGSVDRRLVRVAYLVGTAR